jgi:hypothetical protein
LAVRLTARTPQEDLKSRRDTLTSKEDLTQPLWGTSAFLTFTLDQRKTVTYPLPST